jgi:hypothetical protein
MRRAGHVAYMGEKRDAYRVLVGKIEGVYFEDIGVAVIILKWSLKK